MTVCGQIKQALQLCVIEGMEGRAKNSGGDEDGAFHTPPVFSGSGERGGLAWRCVRVCDAGRCVSAGGAGADTGETRDLISQPTVPLRQVGGLFSLPISPSLVVITELTAGCSSLDVLLGQFLRH